MHMWGIRPYPARVELKPGSAIRFRLRADQYPVEPEKIHVGIVQIIFVDIYDRSQGRYYLVKVGASDDAESDLVYPEQVVVEF